jgi:hypothetical protein
MLLFAFRKHFPRARCTTLRFGIYANDGTIYRASATGVFPVLRPVFFNGATGLADVFKVSTTEVLVLLNI